MEPLNFQIKVDNTGAIVAFSGLERALQSIGDRTSQVNQSLEGFRGKIVTMASSLVGMQIGLTSVGSAMRYMTESFSKGAQLLNLSRATGQSVGDLVTMQRALQSVGISAESLRMYLFMLQRSIAQVSGGAHGLGQSMVADAGGGMDAVAMHTRGAAGAFQQLGLRADELRKLPARMQLAAIAEGLKRLKDQSQQTDVMRSLFGRSGPQLLSGLKDEDFVAKLKAPMSLYAQLMERNAKMFESIETGMKALQLRFTEFASVIAERVGPTLNMLLTRFKDMDGAEVAKKFEVIGDGLNLLITYIGEGVTVIGRIVGFFGYMANAIGIGTKAIIAMGVAYSAMMAVKILENLAAKIVAFTKSAIGIKTETQALNENTAAQAKNAAARGAGGIAGLTPLQRQTAIAGLTAGKMVPESFFTALNAGKVDSFGSAMKALVGDFQATSIAGLAAAASIGTFIGVLATNIIMQKIAELQALEAEFDKLSHLEDEARKRHRDQTEPTTKSEKEADVKQQQQVVDELQEDYNDAVKKAQPFLDKKNAADAEVEAARLSTGGTSSMRYRAAVKAAAEANDNYQSANSAAESIKSGPGMLDDARKRLKHLQGIPDAGLPGGGGPADIMAINKMMTGDAQSIPEMLKPEHWVQTEQHLHQVATELSKLTARRYELQIDVATDATAKISAIDDHAREVVEQFNRLSGQSEVSGISPTRERAGELMDEAEAHKANAAEIAKSVGAEKSIAEWKGETTTAWGKELMLAKMYEDLSKEILTDADKMLKAQQEQADLAAEVVKHQSDVAKLHAQAAGNTGAVAEIDRAEKLAELTEKAAKLQRENPAQYARMYGNATPDQVGFSQRADDEAAAEYEKKLALEKMQIENEILQLKAQGNFAGAAELENQQRLVDLTKEYKKLIIESGKYKDDADQDAKANADALAEAQAHLFNEKAPDRQKTLDEARVTSLKVAGNYQEANQLERQIKLREKVKELAAEGFTKENGFDPEAMASSMLRNEEALKNQQTKLERLTDSDRSKGLFAGVRGVPNMGMMMLNGGLPAVAHDSLGTMGLNSQPEMMARAAIGPVRQDPESVRYARATAANTAKIAEHVTPKKPDGRSENGGVVS